MLQSLIVHSLTLEGKKQIVMSVLRMLDLILAQSALQEEGIMGTLLPPPKLASRLMPGRTLPPGCLGVHQDTVSISPMKVLTSG